MTLWQGVKVFLYGCAVEFFTVHILLADAKLPPMGTNAHAAVLTGFGVAALVGAWVGRRY